MTPTNWLRAVALGLALAAPAYAQLPPSSIWSNPELPSAEGLARLNLRMAWNAAVPTDGRRDGLLRVEVIGNDLFVLTRAGLMVRLDAETGRVAWRGRVGKPYTVQPYLVANSRSVYAIANAQMYAFDRATGAQRWDFPMPAGVSASPAVDESRLYLSSVTTRLYAFYLPVVLTAGEAQSTGLPAGESLVYRREAEEQRIRPTPIWVDQTNMQLPFQPVQSDQELLVVSPEGEVIGISKIAAEDAARTLYSFSLDGLVSVQPAIGFTRVGDGDKGRELSTAYIGSDDSNLYAVNMRTGKLRWRYTIGAPVVRRAAVIGNDVFVTGRNEGMARLDAQSGEPLWRLPRRGNRVSDINPEADRFLAANDRFLYVNDFTGRLLVLDRRRGTRLSMFDTVAWRFPVINEVTDRFYLAANNGEIVCLHDRDLKEPIRHQRLKEEAASPVQRQMAQLVDEPGSAKPMPLREALAALEKKYEVPFVIAARAFQEAKQPDPAARMVTPPRTEKKALSDHLQRILDQIDATFQVVDKSVLIVPGKPAAKGKDKDKEKEPDDGGGMKDD